MEKFLPYCLDSFIVPDNLPLLEVVVVNDGSKDKTLEIAKSYESRYPETFRVIDKENGNYGSCINVALKYLRGKYVKVVDADDSVDTENFNEFLAFLQTVDSDLVLSDFITVDEQRRETGKIIYDFGCPSAKMTDLCVTERFQDMEMHAVTYRTKMLVESGYRQTEGVAYTDQQWIFAPMACVKAVSIFNKPVYEYLVGREGQTIAPDVKIRRMADRYAYVKDMIALYRHLVSEAGDEMKSYLDARIYPNIKDIYITCFSNRPKTDWMRFKAFDKEFRRIDAALYATLGEKNKAIGLWRKVNSSPLLDKAFCRLFTFLLKIKLAFKK